MGTTSAGASLRGLGNDDPAVLSVSGRAFRQPTSAPVDHTHYSACAGAVEYVSGGAGKPLAMARALPPGGDCAMLGPGTAGAVLYIQPHLQSRTETTNQVVRVWVGGGGGRGIQYFHPAYLQP